MEVVVLNHILRHIPPVHELLLHEEILECQKQLQLSTEKVKDVIQLELQKIRNNLKHEKREIEPGPFQQDIIDNIKNAMGKWKEKKLKRVINATGTILHTNLGRARLSKEAIQHVVEIASHYSNLEYNIETGKRGSRHDILEHLITEITGAESAIVVNNNAAAVYFVLRAFAKQKEVIVSRGELVEIGGSFRVSAIMEESDAILREVGTTNKTHLHDYKNAITSETAMLLKVHTSNFKIVGFTESVEREQLKSLAKQHNLILYEDLGSGALYDFSSSGIGDEPVVKNILQNGVDLVSFSGDKLLGGPQAGIIAGKKELIDQLKKHQLARVLRVDKMTLAALEVTLQQYANQTDDFYKHNPTLEAILKPIHQIETQVDLFINRCNKITSLEFMKKKDVSKIGGGTMPTEEIETFGVLIKPKNYPSQELEKQLRYAAIPIIGRFVDHHLFLDFRTLSDQDIDDLIKQLQELDENYKS